MVNLVLLEDAAWAPTTAKGGRATPRARRARVLHLLPDLAVGGGSTIVLHHLRHADHDRYEIEVCSLGGAEPLRPSFEATGVQPLRLDVDRDGELRTAARLAGILRRRRIDLVHVHGDQDRKLGQVAALVARVPVVTHLHGEWVHLGVHLPEGAGPARRLKGQVAGRARDWVEHRTVVHYVADSAALEHQFVAHVRSPIAVMRQAVPVEEIDAARRGGSRDRLRAELGLAPGTPVLLTVARIVEGKGHDDLVAMLGRIVVAHPETVLVMVGDGPRRGPITDALTATGLGRNVRVLGDRLDVPGLLSVADVFVFASRTEGVGISVLEAMAASLPVVAYELPALREYARSGVTAELVPLGDVSSFATRVELLLADPLRRSRLGAAARAHIDREHPPGCVARSLESVYERALARR